jgi:hypothetical protein
MIEFGGVRFCRAAQFSWRFALAYLAFPGIPGEYGHHVELLIFDTSFKTFAFSFPRPTYRTATTCERAVFSLRRSDIIIPTFIAFLDPSIYLDQLARMARSLCLLLGASSLADFTHGSMTADNAVLNPTQLLAKPPNRPSPYFFNGQSSHMSKGAFPRTEAQSIRLLGDEGDPTAFAYMRFRVSRHYLFPRSRAVFRSWQRRQSDCQLD